MRDWQDAPMLLFITLVVVDTGLMLVFWELETNPMLSAMGPVGATAFKLIWVGPYAYLWERCKGQVVARVAVWAVAGLYLLVTALNVMYLVSGP